MNVLIINLTRFGDLLQTQPILSGYARNGQKAGLACLENFSAAAELLRDVEYVQALPGAGLLAKLNQDWRYGLAQIRVWEDGLLQQFRPDVVVNFTASLSTRLLSRALLIRAGTMGMNPEQEGFCLDQYGFGLNTNPWVTFLQASSKNRGCSPFNLVDLFWQASKLGSGPREYHLKEPDAQLKSTMRSMLEQACGSGEASDKRNGFVGFQLGASDNRRRWPVAYFAELGGYLEEKLGLVPVLLGSNIEAGLAERYFEAGGKGISLVGKTDLPHLAAAVSELELLVSNDTGTMHLAAGLGVPIVAFFLATAQPWDTGPYKAGNLCLEPDMQCHPCRFNARCEYDHGCRFVITPETVAGFIHHHRTAGEWGQASTKGARAWETSVENDGFMRLASLSGHEKEDRTQWLLMQRSVYKAFLNRDDTEPALQEEYALSKAAQTEIQAALHQAAGLLTLLYEQGKVLSVNPREALKKKFMVTWQRLQSLWDESEYFNVLSYLWLCDSQEAEKGMQSILEMILHWQVLVQRFSSLLT